jgi:glycosyltransferase involved in cell wall biosynthesis/predicted O-methyltransferase YrrM
MMENRIPIVFCLFNDILSGVTSWALELKQAFQGDSKYELLLLNLGPNTNSKYDFNVPDLQEAASVINNFEQAIIVPNYIWHIYPLVTNPNVRFVGFCHSDSDEEYYTPLSKHEPMISEFIAVSPVCARNLAGRIPHRVDDITMLPYGIQVPEILNKSYQVEPIRLVYGGRVMQDQKRVFDFVPLVQSLLKRQTDFAFDIVGDGPDCANLREAMARNAPTDRVRFLGRYAPDQMSKIWFGHDVFIQVSEFEGTSISMLESMAQGAVPVVTAASSGVTSVITHMENGIIVPIGDMDALAYFIDNLAAKPHTLARLGHAAHQNAKDYSMHSYLRSFKRVLDNVSETFNPSRPIEIKSNSSHSAQYKAESTSQKRTQPGTSSEPTKSISPLRKQFSRSGSPNLYLHIGLHKTGTSAIQQFLLENSKILKQNKYLYPEAGVEAAAHHLLPWTLNDEHPEYKNAEKSTEVIWSEIENEIKESQCDKIILSSEDFSSIYKIENLEKLRQLTKDYHTKIVVYLRRQDQLLQSQYREMVKQPGSRISHTIQEFTQNEPWIWHFLDYEQRLKDWADVFGKENIIVRVYEKGQLPQGIFVDFCNAVGLSLSNDYVLPEIVNPTLNRDLLEFLRYCNASLTGDTGHWKLINAVDGISQNIGNKDYFEHHTLLSPDERLEIIQKYEKSNRRVAREYLGRKDGRLFFEPWPESGEFWDPYPGLTIEKLTQIVGEIVIWQQKKIDYLDRKVLKLSLDREKFQKNELKKEKKEKHPDLSQNLRRNTEFFGEKDSNLLEQPKRKEYLQEDKSGILINGPWQPLVRNRDEISIPSSMTMLSDEEVCYLYWLAKEHYDGEGEIVDAGCLLGASTLAFASALEKNPRVLNTRKRIHSYDRFIYEDYMAGIRPDDGVNPGANLLPYFERNIERHKESIRIYPGDIMQQAWSGIPIDILFVDIAKSWKLNNHIISEFYGSLSPGRSILIHQDYFWTSVHWIHLTMQFLSSYFEPIHAPENGCTLAFRLIKKIPTELLNIDYSTYFSKEEAIKLMDIAIAQQTGIHKVFVKGTKVGLLLELQEYGAARTLLEEIKQSFDYSDMPSSVSIRIRKLQKEIDVRAQELPNISLPSNGNEHDTLELDKDRIEILFKRVIKPTGSIDLKDIRFIWSLIEQDRPLVFLEVGVASGYSTVFILEALGEVAQESTLISIDLMEKVYFDNQKDTGFLVGEVFDTTRCNFELYLGNWTADLEDLLDGRQVDMAFIDASHTQPWPTIDTILILPFLKRGGLLIYHDIELYRNPIWANSIGPHHLYSNLDDEKYRAPLGEENYSNIGAIRFNHPYRNYERNLVDILKKEWTNVAPIPLEFIDRINQFVNKYYSIEFAAELAEIVASMNQPTQA